MAMKADMAREWAYEPPSLKAARAARRFVWRDLGGLGRLGAGRLLRRARSQSYEDFLSGANLIDIYLADFLQAIVSLQPLIHAQELVPCLSYKDIEKRGTDLGPDNNQYLILINVDTCAFGRGIVSINVSPRLAARPRARLCC